MKFKYIIINSESSGGETAIILPESVQHKQAVEPEGAISAGFAYLDAFGGICCHGESTSLLLKSRGTVDAKIVEFTLTLMGIRTKDLLAAMAVKELPKIGLR